MERRCEICQREIAADQRAVSTTTGEVVHIRCADNLAQQTYHRRQLWALVHLSTFLCITIGILTVVGFTSSTIVLVTVWAGMHLILHRLWWRLLTARLILYWRLRRYLRL